MARYCNPGQYQGKISSQSHAGFRLLRMLDLRRFLIFAGDRQRAFAINHKVDM